MKIKQISETDQSDSEFKDEQSLFKAVVDASTEAIAISDSQGNIIYINPAHEKLFGRTLDQARNANYRDYYPPESVEILNKEVVPALEKGQTWEGTLDAFGAGGRRFRLWERADTIRDNNGDMLYGFGIMHDDTEKQEKDKSLKEVSELFEKTFDSQQAGILILDADIPPRIVRVNKSFMRIFRYDPMEILGSTTAFLHAGEDALLEFQQQLYSSIEKQGFFCLSDFSMKRKDGSVFPADISVMPLVNDQQERIGWVSVVMDITERKKSENELKETRENLNTILSSLTDMMMKTDPGMTVLWANKEALRYNPDAVGEKCYKVFANRTQPCEGCPCHKALLSGKIEQGTMYWPITTGSPDEGYWHNIGIPIKNSDGTVVSLIEVSRNVTREKIAEKTIIESKERLTEAQHLAHIGSWTWDIETQTLEWSDEVYHIFGVQAGSFQPSAEAFEAMIHPDNKEEFLARRNKMLEEKQHTVIDHRIVLESGKIRYVQERASPVIGENGMIRRVIGTVQDITERREMEAKKRQLRKAESLNRMAGAVAHRFNNNLSVVMGNLEMAMDDVPNREITKKLAEAMRAAQKAAKISSMMLTYLGQISGNRDSLDISALCRQSLLKFCDTMPETIDFLADLPSPGPVITANADQIRQIVANLVDNAVESLGKDKGTVHLAVRTVFPADIPAIYRFPANWLPQDVCYACLEVKDTGCGIPKDEIENLFDPFFSTQFTGRGLGLSVVLGIARAYSGGITVENDQGKGSVFRVFFPASEKALSVQEDRTSGPDNAQADKKTETPALETGGTVLVADDEEMVRSITEAMLNRFGFNVITARNGSEAVEIYAENKERICMVLSDLSMPCMSGWETLEALRRINPDIPVILASGYDEAHIMSGEHTEYPQAFLQKPYTRKELENTLNALEEIQNLKNKDVK
ncbi:MAG: PAS domain S-box protein [Desulfobacteraceae bacterium]|nr:PAS domain S-box protein [Desulfobacteraceae bacterium]